jgi:hypothetical protein
MRPPHVHVCVRAGTAAGLAAAHRAAVVAAITAALTLVTSEPLPAQTPRAPQPVARDVAAAQAERAAQPPAIDGRDDDVVWSTAPAFSDFRQFDPQPDGDPSFRTEFKVAYDDRNLYVYIRAFDPHPDSIMRALSRRDVRGPSDQLKIIVGSYNDGRTGYEFAVNPDGVKRDYAVYDDASEDDSWNGIWDVATVVDSLGWAAEFRIPLSQLRYADAPSHTFGFGVWRDIERYRERTSWPLYSTTTIGLMSQLGELRGIRGITSSRALEVTPYMVTKNVSRVQTGGEFGRAQEVAVGADLKYGITPNVTLDATINPDFGQIEADPAVLNLSAFETFLAERRPFFVEGTGLYQFQLNCYIVVDCQTNEGLFYSRRIGRTPVLRNAYGDATTPTSTPIAAAAKLTGRTRGGLSFGLLDAVTPDVDGANGRTVEPLTNFAVLRAQQDLRGGRAGISLIATAVNRSLDEWTDPVLHRGAYAAGINARSRFGGGNYEVAGLLTASHVTGTAQAIEQTQRSAVHYFQQPDDQHEVDPSRTSLSGLSGQLKVGKYGGGITRFETSFVRHSAGFEVNDLGYLQRADLQDWSTWGSLMFRTPTRTYRWAQFNANHWQRWNTTGTRLETAFNVNGHMGLHNNWNIHAGGTLGGIGETYCDRCTRGGPLLRRSRGFYPWFGVNGDSRMVVVPSLWVNLAYYDEGRSRSTSLSPSAMLRLSTRLQANIGAGLTHSDNSTQWFGNFAGEDGGLQHSFAHLDQRTISLNTRINYTLSPDLTFEFYGQPFVSSGTYTDFRELSATPGAADYDDRFQPFTPPAGAATAFKFTRLRTNTVLRWEYRPGSTLFVVWAHGREAFTDEDMRQPWHTDYRDLFELRPDNTFLIKVAYWLNR